MKNTPVYQLTREGFENLKKEEQALINKRPQVVINLTNAREQGDLSENAGYHAAKEELSWIDSRLNQIRYIKRFAKVVEADKKPQVAFGSTVTIESNGTTNQFTIVSAMEADPAKHKISDSSPIGSALIGKKAGQEVALETEDGKIKYKIIEVN